MRPVDYLLDRLPLLLAFALTTVFLLLIVHLAIAPLNSGDVLYLVLLALVTTGIILAVDYLRQRAFRRELARRIAEPGAAPLAGAANREQRAFTELLARIQARHGAEIGELREQAERHRTFVDLWVHHMKTPVSVLQLTVQDPDEAAWASVAEETDRLAEGLEIMLATARLERFELDVRPARVDLVELARDTVNELRSSWLLAGMYPQVSSNGEALTESDAKWLRVVLRQLLVNAIKYGERGQRVSVSVSDSQLSVTDEGPGIPASELPRVFDRFFTGSRGRGSASTGMGLHLAAQICARLGHELRIDSQEGKGTTVTVTFSPGGLHRLGDTAVRFGAGT